jgi:rhodanese-related sulfurtransferase
MQTITRDLVKEKIDHEEALVVDALGHDAFDESHLPGAINVPVDDEFDLHIQEAVPDKDQEVIVYCMNRDCDASTRAAERMERLGYQHVFEYEGGKRDWEQAGMPVETALK